MAMPTSPRLGMPFLAAGQAQKELTHNEALALIDAALNASAESAGVDVPPALPSRGQCWVVGATPTGAWAGQAGTLACWTDGGWRFVSPVKGMRVWVEDQQLFAMWTVDGWTFGETSIARLVVDGQQVVGPRQPGVPVPDGGSTIDLEARAAIGAIVARLAAHGLIDA